MKKLLIGTTALVAASLIVGQASAEEKMKAEKINLGLGGFMEQWVGVASNKSSYENNQTTIINNSDTGMLSDSEVYVTGKTKLDNGMTASVMVQLETDKRNGGGTIDESYLTLGNMDSWGEVRMGSQSQPSVIMYYAPTAMGAGTGDVTTWVQKPTAVRVVDGGAANLLYIQHDLTSKPLGVAYYSPRFSGVQVGGWVSRSSGSTGNTGTSNKLADGGSSSLAANYVADFSGVGVNLAAYYDVDGQNTGVTSTDTLTTRGVAAQISFSGFGATVAYKNSNDHNIGTTSNDGQMYSVGVSYSTGPIGVSAVYLRSEVEGAIATIGDDTIDEVEIGVNYNLGPGVDVKGSLFWVDYQNEGTGQQLANNNSGYAAVAGIKLGF